jgi:hypothetical protein
MLKCAAVSDVVSACSSSECVRNALYLPRPLGGDVEAELAAAQLGMRCRPGLRRPRDTPHLLGGDHLERVAPLSPALRLHLAEDDGATAADDEIELVATDPRISGQDPVAAQSVMPQGAALGPRPDRASVRPPRAGLLLLLR